MIKFSRELEKQFNDIDKRIRLWETWKLKTQNANEEKSTWDRMSKHNQEFNLVWNELRGIVSETTLPKLKKILAAAKETR